MTLIYEVRGLNAAPIFVPTLEDAIDLIESLEVIPMTAEIRVHRDDTYWSIAYCSLQFAGAG